MKHGFEQRLECCDVAQVDIDSPVHRVVADQRGVMVIVRKIDVQIVRLRVFGLDLQLLCSCENPGDGSVILCSGCVEVLVACLYAESQPDSIRNDLDEGVATDVDRIVRRAELCSARKAAEKNESEDLKAHDRLIAREGVRVR